MIKANQQTQVLDVVIIGGGLVGGLTALLLAGQLLLERLVGVSLCNFVPNKEPRFHLAPSKNQFLFII